MNSIHLLPMAAAICLFIALVEAWILTMVRYLDARFIKKVFKNYRDLVRSHVDYLIMSALIFGVYLVVQTLMITLPSTIIWLIFIGALYNPFGFILQAIKPDIVASQGLIGKIGVVFGFLPLSIGLFWTSVEIIQVCAARL